MSAVISEKFAGRTLSDVFAERVYTIEGTDDDDAALALLMSTAPASLGELLREEARVEQVGDDLWLGVASYRLPEEEEVEDSDSDSDSDFDSDSDSDGSDANTSHPSGGQPGDGGVVSFQTSGGTANIKQSLATVGQYTASWASALDYKQSINVNDQSVEGVDIVVPVYSFSETHYFAPNFVNNAYRSLLVLMTGTVNSSSFRGLAAGECLFLGAAGSRRLSQNSYWEITFVFAGSPNITGLSIGDITGIAKKGWEYLWAKYEPRVEDDALLLQPSEVLIEKVYREADHNVLGI